jgi:ERCC4-type nuclease
MPYSDVYEPAKITDALSDIFSNRGNFTDYSWESKDGTRVGVERKSVSDLLQSLSSGRLSDQLRRLCAECDFPVLLIEGPLDTNSKGFIVTRRWATTRLKNGKLKKVKKQRVTGWKLHSFIPAVYGYARLLGVTIMYSPHIDDTADVIRWMYEWDQKGSHSALLVPKRTKLQSPKQGVLALASLVGPHAATILCEHFGSLRGVVDHAAEAGKVKGIGPVTAKKLLKVIDE